ncbi:dimethylaniline monooxygenase (n-oxide forming) [Phlyctema vagabunda]|uniref:Dimethylaniline monooxygenase (N-oxide forming) n=1 Tax=Phlyctema vagabunda TaxID=108571 RepID=A0ABR4PBK0_9HELO
MSRSKRVAIIGAGPAGAISIDAFAQEHAFDLIRVFERRERPGGCWLSDKNQHPPLPPGEFGKISSRKADPPLDIPEKVPAQFPKQTRLRYAETSVYPYLESNIDAQVMEFSQEAIPIQRSQRSISLHGEDTPFRHVSVIQKYVEDLVNRKGYEQLVEYNTTVENVRKINGEWEVTLRKESSTNDFWWKESFDAVVIASGHYSVPYIPDIRGLAEFQARNPHSIEHSKAFRGRERYRGKRVVVVGASVSGADIAVDLVSVAQTPINAVVKGHRPNLYFGDTAFHHPGLRLLPSITHVDAGTRGVYFEDGSVIQDVDFIIFATGYSWALPFLPDIPVRNNRVPDLYLHVFHQRDPSLVFIGAVAAGLTFKVYEWQAVLAARVLAGRAKLPSTDEQIKWEKDRIALKGDGVPFTALYPDFEDYFETVRKLAGDPGSEQPGRKLPKFEKSWVQAFFAGHQKRVAMWERINKEAEEERGTLRSKL